MGSYAIYLYIIAMVDSVHLSNQYCKPVTIGFPRNMPRSILPIHKTCAWLTCLLPPQYFHKYCVDGMSTRHDPSCGWDREGAWGKLLAWRKRSSNEGGIVLGPGVDSMFIGGLADEVQGFSGREVGERSGARFPRFVLDAECGVPVTSSFEN